MIGKILGNRYQVVEKIGDGGTAFVFRGLDSLLNRSVTVKVLRPEYVSDQDFVRRFRREAQAAASLSHPNIVSIYDVGQEDGVHYIVMEYVKGQSLKEQINNLGRLPLRMALDYACQIAHALSHAHRHGIIHRDVKPHNILINEEGRVKVTDFGIAQAVTAATVTYNGAILGSVHYFSPEQASGGHTGDKSDIYSLGVVLYEMLSGSVPFAGDTPVSVALKHVQEPFPDVRAQNGEVTAAVSQIIRRAVAKDPEKRYDSARQMAQDLADLMQGRSLPVAEDDQEEEEPSRQKVKGKGKRPFPWRAVVLGSLLLVLLTVMAGVMQLREMLVVPEVEVPLVEGESLTNATRILEESGLKNYRIVESLHDEDVPLGHVLRQSPSAGRKVKQTRQIELTLSAGPVLVVIEDVTGKTELEATLILEGLGFLVWPVREHSDQAPPGTVIKQDPGEGFTLPRGSRVTITVSQGGRPFPMKDLTRASLEEARVWLELFGLRQRLVDEEESELPAGTVVRQTPSAGEMVQAGDFVDLVISSGPAATAAYRIDIETANLPRGVLVTVFISDAQGPREESYVSTGEIIQTFGYGSGTVEIRWLDEVEHRTFP